MTRRSWVDLEGGLPVVRQCVLTGVSRASVYVRNRPVETDESDLRLCCLIDKEYTRRPFYGSRRMVVFLKAAGYGINRKRVQRLMRQMGLAGMAPGPNTSRPHPEHRIITVERPVKIVSHEGWPRGGWGGCLVTNILTDPEPTFFFAFMNLVHHTRTAGA